MRNDVINYLVGTNITSSNNGNNQLDQNTTETNLPITVEIRRIAQDEKRNDNDILVQIPIDRVDRQLVSTAIQTENDEQHDDCLLNSEFTYDGSPSDEHPDESVEEFDDLEPGIGIEEITLRKSMSDDRLGVTVSYSSGNLSESDDTTDNNTFTEVYISDIVPDSVAARDGRLRQGDQILQVNGKDVSNREETENFLAENKDAVTLLVSRCYYGVSTKN